MSGDTLFIKPLYGDPVDNPQIRQDGILDALNNINTIDLTESIVYDYNPIIGYYGDTRKYSDGTAKTHYGFDYLAPKGTAVKSVHEGRIGWVRIGVTKEVETCKIRKRILSSRTNKENCFSEEDCKTCKNNRKCYGVQMWLSWTETHAGKKTTRYAFYAHLSKLDDRIWNAIKDKISEKVIDYNPGIKVSAVGEVLGLSGCTGNAYNMKKYQQHLHFECLDAKLKKQNPNAIVKTKFELAKGLDDVDRDRRQLQKAIRPFLNNSITLSDLREIFLSIDEKQETYIMIQKTEKYGE